jgi:hypothetical protein
MHRKHYSSVAFYGLLPGNGYCIVACFVVIAWQPVYLWGRAHSTMEGESSCGRVPHILITVFICTGQSFYDITRYSLYRFLDTVPSSYIGSNIGLLIIIFKQYH